MLDENATPAGAAECLLQGAGGPNGPRLQMDKKTGDENLPAGSRLDVAGMCGAGDPNGSGGNDN